MTRILYYSIAAALILLLSTPAVSGEVGVQVVFSDGEDGKGQQILTARHR